MILIQKIQKQLESLYGIGLDHRVDDYLISKKDLILLYEHLQSIKLPKELLLVRKSEEDTVEVALYLDYQLIKNLSHHNPFETINHQNLSDFCILIEGVSHFVYFLWKAQQNRAITQLEMELQAEIDKFLMLYFFLRSDKNPRITMQIFSALFEDYHLLEELSEEKKERYITASTLASRYCYYLQKKLQSRDHKMGDLIKEIRRFYAYSQESKIRYILN